MRKTCGSSKNSSFLNSSVCLRENRVPRLRKSVLKVGNYGIEDKGHLEYYSKVAPVCGEKKGKKGWSGVSTKKRMKLLKGLVNDLSMFSELSFGSELDCDKERTVSVSNSSPLFNYIFEKCPSTSSIKLLSVI